MNEEKVYDLIIIGGGPAGAAATVYAARKQLKTAIIFGEWGGQSQISETIYNWIGIKEISGQQLAQDLKNHALSYVGPFLDSYDNQKVASIVKNGNNTFTVSTDAGKSFNTLSVLVCSGSSRRKLVAENADKYEHKGITYCSTCDGPVFTGQDVIVVGGGNAGMEAVLQLSAYCKSVTIIHRNPEFKADKITVEKTLAKPNVKSIMNADITRVDGETFVKSLTYKDKATGIETTLSTGGIFVEIGQIPNSDFVKDLLPLTPVNNIIVDPTNQRTPVMGIWAAGDVTNGLYHQNNIAAGDAVKAIEDIYQFVQTGH
jgi:alkyl hydroperoxide reductase subunit F